MRIPRLSFRARVVSVVAVASLTWSPCASAQGSGPTLVGSTTVAEGPRPDSAAVGDVGDTAAAAVRSCSHRWVGREGEIEAFLREAPVVRFEDIPIGVTKPRRGFFAEGALVGSMAWKVLPPAASRRGFEESHRAEIAAYRLSRLLGMDMVPPVVERRIRGAAGAAVMWIDDVRPWDVRNPPRAPGRLWSHRVSRMKLFDQLIANIDRNRGNMLHDADGHLFLIDHSRAFTTRTSLKGLEGPSQIDRALWERIDALTREDLDAALGDTLTSSQIRALLKRRDAMRRLVDEKVRSQGETIAFLPTLSEDGATAMSRVVRMPGA